MLVENMSTTAVQIPVASTSIAVSAANFILIPVVSTFIPVTQRGGALDADADPASHAPKATRQEVVWCELSSLFAGEASMNRTLYISDDGDDANDGFTLRTPVYSATTQSTCT